MAKVERLGQGCRQGRARAQKVEVFMMKKIGLLMALALFGGLAAGWLWPKGEAAPAAELAVPGSAANLAGFARAIEPRPFVFPLDHGPHPDFQTEWWYYTGNLSGPDGRRYGFQLTFFRRALLPGGAVQPRTSAWATNQVYLAHFTLTDAGAGRFRFIQRTSRGAAGLAGAEGEPLYRVWLEDWQVGQNEDGSYRLQAAAEDVALELDLRDLKGPILQGESGLSRKGPEPGSASYYVSQPRLAASGTIRIGDKLEPVAGESWMDHEFSTSALAAGEVGWDWYALQLSDGSELMLYSLRRADGSSSEFSSGTLIRPDGTTRSLAKADFSVEAQSTWKSPHSGAVYPAGWQIEIRGEGLSLLVKPRLADQELRLSFTYWEGAVEVSGTRAGKPIQGSGYVELTGYAASMEGQF